MGTGGAILNWLLGKVRRLNEAYRNAGGGVSQAVRPLRGIFLKQRYTFACNLAYLCIGIMQ